jgi:hypothetical protein
LRPVRPDDRHHHLHERPPSRTRARPGAGAGVAAGVSGSTSTAPSPVVYASSAVLRDVEPDALVARRHAHGTASETT